MHQYFVFPFADSQRFDFLMVHNLWGRSVFTKGSPIDINPNNKKDHGNYRDGNFNGNISRNVGILAQLKQGK